MLKIALNALASGAARKTPLGGSECPLNPKFHFAHPLKLNPRSDALFGSQLEATKAFHPDSSLGESWHIFSSADSELNIFR